MPIYTKLLLTCREGKIKMVKVYYKLIIEGRRSFDSVPDNLKEDVKAMLNENGYNTDGTPIER